MVSSPKNDKQSSSRGSASIQFPGKLHDLMTYTEREGLTDIIAWVQNGQAFMVHDPERLLKLLPHFGFSQTKYRSFQRQLNMWHWERIVDGPFKGGWVHPYFIRGNKLLCRYMSRHGIHTPDVMEFQRTAQGMSHHNTIPQLFYKSSLIAPIKAHVDRIEFPLKTLPILSHDPPKMDSTESSTTDDDWEPLPASLFYDDDIKSFGGRLLPVHFFEQSNSFLPLGETEKMILEPTPLRESIIGMSRLLEPLSPETIDDIF